MKVRNYMLFISIALVGIGSIYGVRQLSRRQLRDEIKANIQTIKEADLDDATPDQLAPETGAMIDQLAEFDSRRAEKYRKRLQETMKEREAAIKKAQRRMMPGAWPAATAAP